MIRTALTAAFLALAAPALAQDDPIHATIQGQMDAFKAEDAATAFTYAAPNIKRMFGTSERFGAMVRNGYPMVWDNAEITFLDRREIAGGQWQTVQVQDEAGAFHYLDYLMIETPDGWQIAAVQMVQPPAASV
ncbi:MAG: DUF4864 domain-containing protein [Shimia sp.]